MNIGISLLASLLLAFALDYWLREPKRLHPLVGFGRYADWLEGLFNSQQNSRLFGLLAWILAVLPITLVALMLCSWLLENISLLGWLAMCLSLLSDSPNGINYTQTDVALYTLVAGFFLYLALGWQSLLQHAQAVVVPLQQGNLDAARQAVSFIVSRDTQDLDVAAIATAATESVLENGADAIFAPIFWFLLAGIPGVVLYRLSNTLDAMWGYKTSRFLQFGWAAARIDDVLNFIPARLTALSYTLVGAIDGNGQIAWRSWHQQTGNWKSPNAGPVMAAGAGALAVQLGGEAPYHGTMQTRPILGAGEKPNPQSLVAACRLVNRSLVLWFVVLAVCLVVVDVVGLGSFL